MERDEGSTHVLEAIILSLILLGAAHSVATLRSERADTERPRASLERTARDAMTILSGLEDQNGTLLDAYLTEAFHCALDEIPSATSCEGRRSANLSLKIHYYLPPGAGYAIGLDNGIATRDVYRSVVPAGETVTATFAYTPRWNLTFLMPELSCYETGMAVNLTGLPLRNGNLATLTSFSVNASSGKLADAVPAHLSGAWNATLPAATRPSAGVIDAVATGRAGHFPGGFTLGSCTLGGLGDTIVDALRQTTLDATPATVPAGTSVSFAADLSPLSALPGLTILASNVTIYEPLPLRGTEPDTYVPLKVLDLSGAEDGPVAWTVPEESLLGVHPVVLKARVRTALGHEVEVRLVDIVTVALPGGTVPIDPPYRATLQVWFTDWR